VPSKPTNDIDGNDIYFKRRRRPATIRAQVKVRAQLTRLGTFTVSLYDSELDPLDPKLIIIVLYDIAASDLRRRQKPQPRPNGHFGEAGVLSNECIGRPRQGRAPVAHIALARHERCHIRREVRPLERPYDRGRRHSCDHPPCESGGRASEPTPKYAGRLLE
jgi:hypothetical protein